MNSVFRIYIFFALSLLLITLAFGLLATWAFLYPETYNRFLPFYELRPFHVSAALFWIISGAVASIWYYKREELPFVKASERYGSLFMLLWMLMTFIIFGCYAFKKFGGREYWEFPPLLCIPLLFAWVFLMIGYFIPWYKAANQKPLYVWMWSTGVFFFFITFIEQNLWQIPWFRYSFLREVTIQWKSNGSMVGAWNQMIYGTALFLMVKISGDPSMARGPKAFFFYFLGLSNLMFNWGHHIYNVPTAHWIRDGAYIISMTEFLFLISMIQSFKAKLEEQRKLKHLITYRFLIAAEFWVFMNLLLALAMSIPAINRYTHGTHITVAHAMGATIGINTMILLGSFTYILGIDTKTEQNKGIIRAFYWISQFSLVIFWITLITAGIIKGYRVTALEINDFNKMMKPVFQTINVLAYAGIGLIIGLGSICIIYLKEILNTRQTILQYYNKFN